MINSSRYAAVKIGTERKTIKDSGLKVWGAKSRARSIFRILDFQIRCLILALIFSPMSQHVIDHAYAEKTSRQHSWNGLAGRSPSALSEGVGKLREPQP